MLVSIYADCIVPEDSQLDLERYEDGGGVFFSILLRSKGGMPAFRLDHLSPAQVAALGGLCRRAAEEKPAGVK